ncbi:MAG: glutaredoxin family protein [Candidatus Dormiibacterota bacterium]
MKADRVELITRRNCPLCDLASDSLREVAADLGLGVSEFDVDEDSELLRQFTDRVPVIRYRAQVVAEGWIDRARIRERLAQLVAPAQGQPDDSVTAAEIELDRG